MTSLKAKLILALTIMIVILFVISGVLFVNEKKQQSVHDIYVTARSFAELTAPKIASDYTLYLSQKSFIYFNRDVQDMFQKLPELKSMQVLSYDGKILYDSDQEKDKQYDGPQRSIDDKQILQEVKSRNMSVLLQGSNRVVYLKKGTDASYSEVDFDEKPVSQLSSNDRIVYFVQPANDQLAVLYRISYDLLDQRVGQTVIRSSVLTLFGVMLAILFAVLFSGTITRPIKTLTAGVDNISKGNFAYRVEVKTKDELKVLADAFNKMAADLDVSTKAMVYKERVAKELEIAAKIQTQLLPKVIPSMPSLDVAAGLLPAEEIGGDCYDFIKTDNDNLLMYLGDVTGHGVPSGIVVSIANALIYNFSADPSIRDMLIKVNRILKEKTTSNMFMTLVALRWNEIEKKLKFVNAGHEQMVYYKASDKSITLTPPGGLALGMMKDIGQLLVEREMSMEAGDVLVVYSDGIPECWRNDKEMFGMEKLKETVQMYGELPTASRIHDAIIKEVKDYAAGYKQMDDITLIVLKRKN